MEWIANSLALCGEIEGAVEAYKRYADSTDDKAEKARAYYLIAKIVMLMDDAGRAIDWLETSFSIRPTKESKRLLRRIQSLQRLRSQVRQTKLSTD